MYQSDQINELAKALAAAQAEMKQPVKNSKNPHFGNRYADLHEVITSATPILARHGLSVTQTTTIENGAVVLHTRLLHTSGQWISSSYPVVPVKPDPQGYGSAMTYARRYSLSAIIGLAADDDDDGEAASGSKTTIASPSSRSAPLSKPSPAQVPTVNGRSRAQPAASTVATAELEDLDAPDPALAEPGDFVIPIGKNAGKRLRDLPRETVAWYAIDLKPTSEQGIALQAAAKAYLAQQGSEG